MNLLPETLELITEQLSRFPGIGKKTAQRMAFDLLKWPPEDVGRLGDLLKASVEKIGVCSVCGLIAEVDPCPICVNPGRDDRLLCVVEDTMDVVAIERTGRFRGKYHVLGGVLSPLEGVGPDALNIDSFLKRLDRVEEIILALNPSIEGETTALYLARLMGNRTIKISRLARGVPMGGDLEYIDEATLGRALEERNPL